MNWRHFILGIWVLVLPGIAFSVQPDEILADKHLEARARAISQELRCLVCQNQSIDDSDADLARDLRVLVRKRLEAGDSDAQVKEYIVARYGNYVLLNPPFALSTLVLWLGPLFLLVVGAGITIYVFKGRDKKSAIAELMPLSSEEKERLETLLHTKEQ